MTEFALLIGGQFRETRNYEMRPENIPHKAVQWFPVIREYGEPGEGVEGDAYVIRVVDPATLPPPLPPQISDRQFFHVLALNGSITQKEALAAVKTGYIPATLMALVNALPDDQRFNAEMLLSGATVFERTHPLTNSLGAAMGYSPDQIDDLFRAAAQL